MRRKNKAHDARVEELGCLVGHCNHLKIEPLVRPAFAAMGVGVVVLAAASYCLPGELPKVAIVSGGILSFGGGIAWVVGDDPITHDRIEEAKYLDEKVREFYK